MNLFEMLIYTKDPNNNYKYHVVSESIKNKDNQDSNKIERAVIIPKVEDSTAVISMVKNFGLTEDLTEVSTLIECVLTIYIFSKDVGGVEYIKAIQELLQTIANHKDFTISKKQLKNKWDARRHYFVGMVPLLSPYITDSIMAGKNFIPLYEAIGKMYELCIKNTNITDSKDGGLMASVDILKNDIMVITISSVLHLFRCNTHNVSLETIKNLDVDEDHFNRFIKLINSMINIKAEQSQKRRGDFESGEF